MSRGPVRYVSELGEKHGANPLPMVIFGHDAADTAGFVAEVSTISTVAVDSLADLAAILAHDDVLGIWAHSHEGRDGEAEAAIEAVRKARGRRVSIYGAWTPDVRAEAARAVACRADGLILPEVDAAELFAYIFAIYQWAEGGGHPPADVAAHIELLRRHFKTSKVWWAAANRILDPA